MGVEIYETGRGQDYASGGYGQVVSRTLDRIVERGDMPFDGGFGLAGIAGPAETDRREVTVQPVPYGGEEKPYRFTRPLLDRFMVTKPA